MVVAQEGWRARLGDPVRAVGSSFHLWGADHVTPLVEQELAAWRPAAVAWTDAWVIGFTRRNEPRRNREAVEALLRLRGAADLR